MLNYKESIICITSFAAAFIMNDYVIDYLNNESEVGIANLCFSQINKQVRLYHTI